jgi:hypothetical protein
MRYTSLPAVERFAVTVVASLTVACIAPTPMPVQPSPVVLSTARTSIQATQVAAQQLAVDGFDLITSDATGGVITAKRTRAKDGNSGFIACFFKPGSLAASNMESTITITFTATQIETGSSIRIVSRVHTSYPGLANAGMLLARAPSDDDCASNGTEDAKLAAAVK